jgi:hypothetical protein
LPKKATDSIVVNGEMQVAIDKREKISNTKTPKQMVKKKGDGFDYVEEAYMRAMLDKVYPHWSWLPAPNDAVQFLGSEWVVVSGVLEITEEETGRTRRFFSPGAARVQFKKNQPHTVENVIDIDKNVASANAYGFKRACNRLAHIADDVYRKQVRTDFMTEEQDKSYDELIQQAQKLGMPLTRLATWKNAKEEVFQSNFADAYNSFYEEVNHLKTNKKTNKENK